MSGNKPKHVEIWTHHYHYHWPLKGNIIFFSFLYPISIGWPDHRPSCVDIELKMPWISAATKSLDYSDKLLYNTNSNANNSLETAVLWSPWLRMLFFISGEWEVGKELSCSYLYHLYCGVSDGNYCQAWLILDSPPIIKKAFKSFVKPPLDIIT